MGIVVTIVLVLAVVLSVQSHYKKFPGLVEGRLYRCPDTPNCLCSEYPEHKNYIAPFAFTGDADAAWTRLVNVIRETGGKPIKQDKDYLAATYTSLVFRFVDEVELRLDRSARQIHIRSASRVGHSDLGVNARRVARIRAVYAKGRNP